MREVLLFFAAFVAVLVVIGMMVGWSAFVDWQENVKTSRRLRADIMSRDEDDAPANVAPSLQTRPQTAPDQTEDPAARRAKLLDTYRALRKHGISRKDAQALLHMWNLPLDNNLWAQAATPEPPPEQTYHTPIAGRPTDPRLYHDDPELEYQPLR